MHKILIKFDNQSLEAVLNDSATSKALWHKLPLESQVNTWGDEIYFETPIDMPQEPDAQEIVSVGDIGYWPIGRAFCIFFGPTPASTDEQPRAYGPVNLLGKVLQDCDGLKSIQNQQSVRVERLED
jgi:hypothetical protein